VNTTQDTTKQDGIRKLKMYIHTPYILINHEGFVEKWVLLRVNLCYGSSPESETNIAGVTGFDGLFKTRTIKKVTKWNFCTQLCSREVSRDWGQKFVKMFWNVYEIYWRKALLIKTWDVCLLQSTYKIFKLYYQIVFIQER
jgi:hypothetical protein